MAGEYLRERRATTRPVLSVCVPHHNRTSFFLEVCRSLDAQTFRAFELCISDDCSTDGREEEVLEFLGRSRLAYAYKRQAVNRRYDGNLREAMALAAGRWIFLLGNDDVVKGPDTFGELARVLEAAEAQVAFTNYEDFSTGVISRRATATRLLGSGPRLAVASFRKFSFVSGVVFDAAAAQAVTTGDWDGSEMYQMYIGCRLIAAGGAALDVDQVTVRKDLQLPGESVDSYAKRGRPVLRSIPVQTIPLGRVAALVFGAVEPYLKVGRRRTVVSLVNQFFGFLCPYWLFEYRRVRSWKFAAGVARGLRPGVTLAGVRLSAIERAYATCVFGVTTLGGLLLPVGLARRLQRPATKLARFVGSLGVTPSRT